MSAVDLFLFIFVGVVAVVGVGYFIYWAYIKGD